MAIFIIFFLIVLNGVFAMAEIAIISTRKSKLKHLAKQGNTDAQKALDLANNPNQLLATVQIGITFIGIFAGAFSAETITITLARYIVNIPFVGIYSENIALLIVVVIITYVSLIIGELVPKRLALSSPEKVAMIMSGPMKMFAAISTPLVRILSLSTDFLLTVFRVHTSPEISISEEEVRMLIQEGVRRGVFNFAERDIVERTFRLSDKTVAALMTPRKEITWLEKDTASEQVRSIISKHPYSYYPICHGTLDNVIGVIRAKEVLTYYSHEHQLNIHKYIRKPIFVPENMDSLKLLETFKKTGIHVALVVDEYGGIEGLLSLTDILEAIVGDMPSIDELEEQTMIKREDGSWLVDGLVTIDEFKEKFDLRTLPDEYNGKFYTIGGFAIYRIGTIPKTGDIFETESLRFEIMDMDGNRVDKLLVRKVEIKM